MIAADGALTLIVRNTHAPGLLRSSTCSLSSSVVFYSLLSCSLLPASIQNTWLQVNDWHVIVDSSLWDQRLFWLHFIVWNCLVTHHQLTIINYTAPVQFIFISESFNNYAIIVEANSALIVSFFLTCYIYLHCTDRCTYVSLMCLINI